MCQLLILAFQKDSSSKFNHWLEMVISTLTSLEFRTYAVKGTEMVGERKMAARERGISIIYWPRHAATQTRLYINIK